jgi:hypothetical protein
MVTDDWLKRLGDPSRDICIPQPPALASCFRQEAPIENIAKSGTAAYTCMINGARVMLSRSLAFDSGLR